MQAGSIKPKNAVEPTAGERPSYRSKAIDDVVREVSSKIADAELAMLFSNCLPNTLDTTITHRTDENSKPDTFIITGDIHAMWLRDSTNQVWPYLCFVGVDPALQNLFRGLIRRQAACVLLDPYANAFLETPGEQTHWSSDHTQMNPGVYERKYELDSLCSVLRLSCGYHDRTGDATCFDQTWLDAMRLIVKIIRREQAGSTEWPEKPQYTFERTTPYASDTLTNRGRGNPFRRTGMSRSPFRPSDDAHIFQFLVPANQMAVVCLQKLSKLLSGLGLDPDVAADASALAAEIDLGVKTHGIVDHPRYGRLFAYEVDGFGGTLLMDDANTPSLLALPYLGYCASSDPVYQATRKFVLSADNPFFSKGSAGEGVCSPHVGVGWIWPISVMIRALTSTDDKEIIQSLGILKASHGGTGFMHETFWKDDPTRFTRSWFAWANSLFGELILHLHQDKPELLKARL
jgi:meiotically up-regulated gene 157 (Mug157) protein